MRIAHYVSVVAGQKGFENNVSGHIQVPLHAIKLLIEAGHECHLITTDYDDSRSLPNCLPKGVTVHTVKDARIRGGVLDRSSSEGKGINPFALFQQLRQIKLICKKENIDILHCYGYNRTSHLAGALKLFGLKIPVVTTMFATFFPERFRYLTSKLWQRIDQVIAATDCTIDALLKNGIDCVKVKHGVIRDLKKEFSDFKSEKDIVLFWRDLTFENGADVTLKAYCALAPDYPNIKFVFAVRKHWNELENFSKIIAKHNNIYLYRFPYQDNISIGTLMQASICVVLPIRDISIDPQLVVLESLSAGIPTITSNHRSNPEIVLNEVTGLLTPLGDSDSLIQSIKKMLDDPEYVVKMSKKAELETNKHWNWDSYAQEISIIYKNLLL